MTQGGEEAAEMITTIRKEHVVMKTWFNGPSPEAVALRTNWGEYPSMWKEVLNWKGWKEARRGFMANLQRNESSSGAAVKTEEGAVKTEEGAETENGDSSVPRKRKSRWGTVEAEPVRKSRWEKSVAPPPPPSRNQPSLPGLPGMPANLPPQQQQEMAKYQSRLRQVNEKLQVVEREAARVDALPRNHRERSPSPPPGTFFEICIF